MSVSRGVDGAVLRGAFDGGGVRSGEVVPAVLGYWPVARQAPVGVIYRREGFCLRHSCMYAYAASRPAPGVPIATRLVFWSLKRPNLACVLLFVSCQPPPLYLASESMALRGFALRA